jgi:DNA invertase Pin-like site-specific DNA recombinase
MSNNGNGLHLSGVGATYIRVSTDHQDTERQRAAVQAFEQAHGVTIAKQHWFKDEGWARDEADQRPAFQRLMKLAESGRGGCRG